jgi:hypothetical protein
MALLPYSVRQVTQRKGGRRERGDRDDRELREEMPRPPIDTDAEVFAVEEADPATAELLGDGAGAGDADGVVDEPDVADVADVEEPA